MFCVNLASTRFVAAWKYALMNVVLGERLTPNLLDHYLHLILDMLQLLWCCFSHLLIQK